jgi:hypothetical protein
VSHCLLNNQTILYLTPLISTEVFTHAKLKPTNAGYLILIDPGVCTAVPVNNTIREPKGNFLLSTIHCITAMNHIPEQKKDKTNNSGKSKILGMVKTQVRRKNAFPKIMEGLQL